MAPEIQAFQQPPTSGMQIDLAPYDFVDFGCSSGGSIAFAMDRLGGRRGLGLDISPAKVNAARAAGFNVEVADVSTLDPDLIGTVRFVVMAHFLEHLPGRKAALACIASACRIAEEFVYIRQPYFDADGYLLSLGLKLYWSDWTGHPYHMSSLDLHNGLHAMLTKNEIARFLIFFRSEIRDSHDAALHPLSSSRDQHAWEAGVHGSKPEHEFPLPVYRETGAIILTKSTRMDDRIAEYLRSCAVVFDSENERDFAPARRLSRWRLTPLRRRLGRVIRGIGRMR
jgi:hypothetical protein